MFVADDLAAWLIGLLADAGRKRLTAWAVGSEQERDLRRAATAAVQLTVADFHPEGGERAEELAAVISEVFCDPLPVLSPGGRATVLEELQARVTLQLAPLADPGLSGAGKSSAEALGVPAAELAEKLVSHLVQEIVTNGIRGGPLAPLAGQLNHDVTHLYLQELEGDIGRLAAELRGALSRPETSRLPIPLGERSGPDRVDVAALMRAQARAADELPYRLFGVRRSPLSGVYVNLSLNSTVAVPGAVPAGGRCSLEEALTRHRHLIVTGGPGQGKSTLTLQLVHGLALDWLAAGDVVGGLHGSPRLVPLRVTGRELASVTDHSWLKGLRDAAVSELGSNLDSEADFQDDLLRQPVDGALWLIVIDGLDEVLEPGRRDKLVSVLSARLADTGLPHRLLITSRPLPSGDMTLLLRGVEDNEVGLYELEPFNRAALQDFARRWLADGTRSSAADPAVQFLAQMRAANLTTELSTPLLALMAVVLFERQPQSTLPRFIYDLYESYLENVLASAVRHPDWQVVTAQLAELSGGSDLGLGRLAVVEEMFRHLAVVQINSDVPLMAAADEWLARNEVQVPRRSFEWQAAIESLLTRSGLLVRRGSRHEFIHYSFAEHLGAAADAATIPDAFDPNNPALRECLNRARDSSANSARVALVHWARRVPTAAQALLTWLQQGHWEDHELAARLLTSGVAGDAQHYDAACQALERRVVLQEEGQPTGMLAALARQYPAAIDALSRISANSMIPPWARSTALAAVIEIREMDAEETAAALRGLLTERKANAGWSQVTAAEVFLDLGDDFRAEAIQTLRDVLSDPYTQPDPKLYAARVLAESGPALRAEALAVQRTIVNDPLAEYVERRFAACGLALAGFPDEAAAALNDILADRRAYVSEKTWMAFVIQSLPLRYKVEFAATYATRMDDVTASPEDRRHAAIVVAKISPDHRSRAITIMRDAITDASWDPWDPYWRIYMANEVASLAPEYFSEVMLALEAILTDREADPEARTNAARAIVRLDFEQYDSVVGILRELTDPSSAPGERCIAARGLALFAPGLQRENFDTFQDLIADPAVPLSTRIQAAGFLGELDSKYCEAATEALRELTANPHASPVDLYNAAYSLFKFNRDSDAEVATYLQAVLRNATVSPQLCANAAILLVQLETAARVEGINKLKEILHDEDAEDEMRIRVARKLAKCGSLYREEALAALDGI